MRLAPASKYCRRRARLPHRFRFALRLAGCFLAITLSTLAGNSISDGAFIWITNGILLAYLLLAPRWTWPAYLGVALTGHYVASAFSPEAWQIRVFIPLLNIGEALLAARMLRSRSAQLPRFVRTAYLIRFLGLAATVPPLIFGIFDGLIESGCFHDSFSSSCVDWVAADCLGILVVTPACIAILRERFRNLLCRKQTLAVLLPAGLFIIISLLQTRLPIAFLLYPLLILILLRLGLGSAAAATLFTAGFGTWLTAHHTGAVAHFSPPSSLPPSAVLQLFVASAMFTLYSVSLVIENLRSTERRLKQTAALHRLVMENSRDVIVIADFDGRRSFISDSGANWGGWSREQLTALKAVDLVHPNDKPAVLAIIRNLKSGKKGALAECRVRKGDGSYAWVEASLRTIYDPITGVPTGILNNVREITQRKLAEQKLADAYHAVETLSVTDPLTGLANRRRFDQYLLTEWRRAMRDRKPISLLLVDADFFKSYNDTYGHLRGDGCLKQIAEAAQDVVSRPGDLVARFGGEEFAIVLPSTANSGAFQLAQDICAVMRNRQLPHIANPLGVVTISVGCATLVPQLGQHAADLVDCADQALYHSKRAGRNRASNYKLGPHAPSQPSDRSTALPLDSHPQ